MLVKYILEMEEVTTCNRCMFSTFQRDSYGEIDGGVLCVHPYHDLPVDVDDYAHLMCTKPEDCPLVKVS